MKFKLIHEYSDFFVLSLFSNSIIIDIRIDYSGRIIKYIRFKHNCNNKCKRYSCTNCFIHDENKPAMIDFIKGTRKYYIDDQCLSSQEFYLKKINKL